MRHKIITYPTAFNFDAPANQIRIGGSSLPIARNIVAASSGRAISASGTRIWDSAVLPASSTQVIQPGTFLTLPFTSSFLPQTFFDAIFDVQVDGVSMPVGFSNSPDNIGIYTANQPIVDEKLFWIDLRCFGLGNALGDPNAANHYMFGGSPGQLGAGNDTRMIFQSFLTESLEVSVSIDYYQYSIGFVHNRSFSASLTPGLKSYVINNSIHSTVVQQATGIILFDSPGYAKFSVQVNRPQYRSLLPFYHWGWA
jgi:hypothetical protein